MAPNNVREIQNLWLHGIGVSTDSPIPEPRHDASVAAQLLSDSRNQTLAWVRACNQNAEVAREWRAKWQTVSEQRDRLAVWLRIAAVGAISGWLLFAGAVRAVYLLCGWLGGGH